jgi:hypothetical protein
VLHKQFIPQLHLLGNINEDHQPSSEEEEYGPEEIWAHQHPLEWVCVFIRRL